MKKSLLFIIAILFLVELLINPFTVASQSLAHPSTDLVVTGDIMHAASGTDFIGVVYSRSGSVYYNQVTAEGVWGEEALLGTGSAARLSIDSNDGPHVVFTTTATPTKIAYLKYNGSNWSEVEYIESLNIGGTGSCSKPDVAVDDSGLVHFTYTDTHGSESDPYTHPDIMYAKKEGESFNIQLIFRGYRDYYSSYGYPADYFNNGSFISLDGEGNYYIISHKYSTWSSMYGNEKYYSVVVKSNLGTGSTSSASSDVFAIYDLDFNGTAVHALYKQTTFKTSELTVSGTAISFSNTQNVSTTTSVSSVAGNSTDMVVGGKTNTYLFTQFNDLGHVYTDVVVKNTIVTVVEVGGVFYAVYTDNGDSNIKIREVAEPLSITRFEVPGQDGPTVIDGQAGTVDVKVEGGTDLTNLVATYSTTTDVTGVTVETVSQTSAVTANDFSLPLTYVLSDGVSSRNWLVTVSVGILDTIEIDICEGDSYEFGTQTLFAAGNYTETFTASNGSDSTVLLILTVNPQYTVSESASICMDDLPYEFGTQNLSSSGVYTEVFQTINECDSTVTLTLTVYPSYNSQMPSTENIIAHYTFNGNANDVSGNEHHGAANGATLAPDRFGNPNGAYSFDGVNDYIDAGDWENGGVMTFNFWAKWEAWHNWSRLLDFGLGEGNNNIYIGNQGTQDNLMFHTLDGATKYLFYCDNTLLLDTWVMITCTIDESGIMKAYQDGELIGTFNGFTPTKMVRTSQYFGRSNWSVDGYFKGAIDEVVIYDIALTADEIQEIYTISQNYIPPVNLEICSSLTPYSFGTQTLTESGTYTQTFQTIHGCDSTVTLNLTVNPVYNHTDEASICQGDTYTFDGQELETSGTYVGEFTSVSGCDSTVTLTLTVNPVYNHAVEASICEGGTYSFDNQELTIAGTYVGEFTSVFGCDSTVTLTLKVNPVYSHTDEMSICEGDSYVFGTQNLTTSGEYEHTFPSVYGCDSTVMLTLTVNPTYNHTDEASICEGNSYTFGSQTLTTAGEYEHTFPSISGCDSTVTLSLTVDPVYNHTDEASICEGDSYDFGGTAYTEPGEYTHTFNSVNGCDSTVTLNLTVYPPYNNMVLACTDLNQTVNVYPETGDLLANVHAEYGDGFSLADWNDLVAIDDIDAWIACMGLENQDLFWILNGGQHFWSGGRHYFVQYFPGGVTGSFTVHAQIGNKLFLGSWYSLQMPILAKNNNPIPEIVVCSNELPYIFGAQNLMGPGQYTEAFQSIHGCDSTVTITLTVNPAYNHTEEASICEGNSYAFGTQTLTTTGEYEETFTSVNDCDSTVTLTLTVDPVYNHTDEASICEGESYDFGGTACTEPGEYTHTFNSVNGCDSTVTLTLTVHPTYNTEVEGTASLLVDDDFEDDALNTLPNGWTIRYNGTGNADQKVVDNPVKNGVHSFQVSGSGWAANLSKLVDNMPDKIVLEGWMRAENVSSGGRCGLAICNPSLGTWGAFVARVEFYNGNLIAYYHTGNSGGYGTQYVLQAAVSNTWYYIKLEADRVAGTYKVYVNDQLSTGTAGGQTYSEFPLLPGVTPTSVELYGNSMIYFDDIKLYEGGNHPVTICESETPYLFGEQELTESGTYVETFASVSGCDSTVTLTLVVNPSYAESETVSVCENDFPYTYDGEEFSDAGVYDILYESQTGCDSIITLTLVSLPVYDQSLEVTVYENDLPYNFGGDEIFEAGEYEKTFTSVNGCDSTVTVNLTISTKDITPPEAACQPIEVLLNVFGNYTLANADILQLAAGSSDNKTVFENLLITVAPETFGCEDAGTYVPVEVTVSDEEGNMAVCATSVHVVDGIAPQADCGSNTFELGETGEVTISADDLCQSFDDACGISEKFLNHDHFTCDNLGENLVKVTVKDNHGNSIGYMVKVTIIDNLAPSFVTIQNMELVAEEGKCSAQIEYPEITAHDNCQIESLYLINGLGAGEEFPIGTSVEQWVAKDHSGNTDTLTFTVTVSGNPTAPTIDPVDGLSVLEDAGPITIPLSGIAKGFECETYDLALGLSNSNDWLISSYQIDYTQGETGGGLTMNLAPDAFGESDIILTLTNTGTGKQTEVAFKLEVQPVNDPPFVLIDIDDAEKTTKDTLMVMVPSEIGTVFGDADPDDLLQVTVSLADGSVLPAWLAYRNDSLIAITTPTAIGCLDLLAKATDLAGEEVSVNFSLCISYPTGVGTLETGAAILVYPNPTSGKVFLKTQNISGDEVDVTVFDLTGRKVLSTRKKLSENMEIDLSKQVSGAYFMKVETEGFQKTFKIIVKH